MPLRERFKQSFKGVTGNVKTLFKHKGADTTRPDTLSSTQLCTTAPVVTGQVGIIGTSVSGTPTTLGAPTNPPGRNVLATGILDSAVDTLMIGPLKEASDMIQGFVDTCFMDGAAKEYETLQKRLRKLLKLLEKRSDELASSTMKSKIQGIHDFIEGELSWIGIKQVGTLSRRLVLAKEEEDRFLACCQRIQEYMDQLSLDTRVSVWKIEEKQVKDHMSSLVTRLPHSPSACYNSGAGEELKRRECTPGTRVDVLATLLAWSHNNSSSGVYWLNGMAGTGKTTIAYSVCKDLDAGLNLAASFFCSRLREECRDVSMIIPSIAYQLARRCCTFRVALSEVIEEDPDTHTKRLDLQFIELIEEPLVSAKPTLPEALVVVIDALDECDNKESTRDILQVLLAKAENLPIKFIVSSRPEPQIRDHMTVEQEDPRLLGVRRPWRPDINTSRRLG